MSNTFTVRIRGAVYAVPLEDIVYMENELRKIRLYLKDGEYLFYGTFRQVLTELDDRFLCCSRSYILNMDHIRAMRSGGGCEIILDSGAHIPLSKGGFQRARRAFDLWLREKQAPAGGRSSLRSAGRTRDVAKRTKPQ